MERVRWVRDIIWFVDAGLGLRCVSVRCTVRESAGSHEDALNDSPSILLLLIWDPKVTTRNMQTPEARR